MRPWGSLSSWLSLLAKFQARERPSLKNQGEWHLGVTSACQISTHTVSHSSKAMWVKEKKMLLCHVDRGQPSEPHVGGLDSLFPEPRGTGVRTLIPFADRCSVQDKAKPKAGARYSGLDCAGALESDPSGATQ